MNILIVEDEVSLSAAIEHILNKHGYITDCVYDGLSALDYIHNNNYDLILLDVMLPKLDGFSVLKQLRNDNINTPVLMLTARNSIDDKVNGLNYGADDYLTKPFDTLELLARINALTRRKGELILNTIKYQDLTLSLNDALLSTTSNSVTLSPKEFNIMRLLLSNPTQTYTKDILISKAWGIDSFASDNNVEAYISFLRKKLKYLKSNITIKNIQKLGYRLENIE